MSGKKFIPDTIDVKIGEMILLMRTRQGMTQQYMAKLLGISPQQFQKYETGDNRVMASRLYKIAQIFQVPIATLYGENIPKGNNAYDRQICDIIKLITYLKPDDRKMIIALGNRLRK